MAASGRWIEDAIKPDLRIDFVGRFQPNTFGGGAYARGIKPDDYAGFESPIPANHNTKNPPAPTEAKAPPAAKDVAVVAAPATALVTGKPARFVRIELPGDKRILTLAEVEVFSAGRNIAAGGKATQSSTYGGVASRAIDGNKHPDWGKKRADAHVEFG